MTGLTPRRRHLASLAVALLGHGCLVFLAVAATLWLDVWQARSFVLLLDGAALCAVVASALAWRAPGGWDLAPARWLLWVLVAAAAGWVWVPPVQRFVGWWIRQVSTLLFQ